MKPYGFIISPETTPAELRYFDRLLRRRFCYKQPVISDYAHSFSAARPHEKSFTREMHKRERQQARKLIRDGLLEYYAQRPLTRTLL